MRSNKKPKRTLADSDRELVIVRVQLGQCEKAFYDLQSKYFALEKKNKKLEQDYRRLWQGDHELCTPPKGL